MQILRASIEILFRNISPDKILKKYFEGRENNITSHDFVQQSFGLLNYYSHDELQNLYQKLDDDWTKGKDGSVIYNLVNEFANKVLTEEQGVPIVQFDHLLRWRELSLRLGEDFFVCNYLAYKDSKQCRERTMFDWRPVLDTNNARLKTLLSKGLAENHFHLFGSAPYCELSWVALMNNVLKQLPRFKKLFKEGLLEKSERAEDCESYRLYFYVLKAAVIRLHFFALLKQDKSPFADEDIRMLLQSESVKQENEYLISQLPSIQSEIELFRFEYGKQFSNAMVADYAIAAASSAEEKGVALLSGERWFLYSMFKNLTESGVQHQIKKESSLFYAYLLFKAKFREEMLQVNTKTGFANFSKYQDRKDLFLEHIPVFENAISGMAIRTSNKNQNIQAFETRITPGALKEISVIDKNVQFQKGDAIERFLSKKEQAKEAANHFYVVHFIKKPDVQTKKDVLLLQKPRHYALRESIKKDAVILAMKREKGQKDVARVYGIDAASNEIVARPEVFAPVFRFLKQHHPKEYQREIKQFLGVPQMPRLRVTYHVGEDFLDIVDGLRAIDEAIKFLEMGDGDRLGHALTLGIDVADYYAFKHRQLLLTKQAVLDNYSWLLSRIAKYGMADCMPLQAMLQHDFRVLFQKIYGNAGLQCDPVLYYQAWTLRGDAPELYETGRYVEKVPITEYDHFLEGKVYPNKEYRKVNAVVDILVAYHYNVEVKKKGSEIMRFDVSDDYIKAVTVIQKRMQQEVAEKHLAIECNPSSNVLIGTFKRYDKHPITNFFNLGLTHDAQALQNCPQIMVSINTDDQGVFNTYLENEYAFMAKALEKAKDKDGKALYNNSMIHDWLEKVRQMGLEMSFRPVGE